MDSELDLNIPTPQKNVAAPQLLADGETSHYGYITKLKQLDGKGISAKFQSFKNLLTPSRPVLVILNRGCLYYFKDETTQKPRGSYTLYGYNRIIRAGDLQTEKRPWVFQIEPASPVMESLAFSTLTKLEMEKWMVAIKKEMLIANRGIAAAEKFLETASHRPPADGKDESLSDYVEQPIYDDLAEVVYAVDIAMKKDPEMIRGKNTDDDDDDDDVEAPDYLEFDSVEQPSTDKHRTQSGIANELTKAFRKKSKDETRKNSLLGKSSLPKVPMVPSKGDFDAHKKGPLPPIPGRGDLKGRKRSEPDGKSFKKAADNSTSPEKPNIALKPLVLKPWKKKTDTEKPPELPPWKDPDLPAGRKNRPKDASASVSSSASPTSKKPSITKEDYDKDPSLYWKCHFFDGTKEDGQAILANLATDGVYLVRDGSVAGAQVLAVYWNKRTHKYVIRHEEGKYFLTSGNDEGLKAKTLEEMLFFYHQNCLPNKGTMLTQPYHLALLGVDKT